MHPDWAADFSQFLAYIGRAPTVKHSVDRIENSLGYIPGNVRWATAKEQARNTSRKSKHALVEGETLAESCERLGLNYKTVTHRIWRGVPRNQLFAKRVKL